MGTSLGPKSISLLPKLVVFGTPLSRSPKFKRFVQINSHFFQMSFERDFKCCSSGILTFIERTVKCLACKVVCLSMFHGNFIGRCCSICIPLFNIYESRFDSVLYKDRYPFACQAVPFQCDSCTLKMRYVHLYDRYMLRSAGVPLCPSCISLFAKYRNNNLLQDTLRHA